GAPIGVAEAQHVLLAAVRVEALDLVLFFVAHIEEAALVPDRTFGKTEIAGDFLDGSGLIEQLPELGRVRFQRKLARRRLSLRPQAVTRQERKEQRRDKHDRLDDSFG